MFIKDIKDPTGMFSQIGRLTAEKFSYQRQNEFDIFDEKKPIEPFSRSLSRQRQRRERESEKPPLLQAMIQQKIQLIYFHFKLINSRFKLLSQHVYRLSEKEKLKGQLN
ncbi:hypothetical protein pb186bvf_017795 [Paramecium bursaria]